MNLLWIQRRNEEEITRRKQSEIQTRVNKWSMERSREESEHLRKRESMKLVAGLEQGHRQEYDEHLHSSAKKTHHTIRPLTAASETTRAKTDTVDIVKGTPASAKMEATNPLDEHLRNNSNPQILVLKGSTKKQDVKKGGGMHFRNQLPANYTSPSRHSNQSSSSSASWNDRGSATPSSASTPSSFGSGKQTLKTPQPRARLDSGSSSGSSGFSDGECSSDDDHADQKDGEPATESETKVSSKTQSVIQRMKLQPYHIPYFTNTHTETPASRARLGLEAISKQLNVSVCVMFYEANHTVSCQIRHTEPLEFVCRCIRAERSRHRSSQPIRSSATSTTRRKTVACLALPSKNPREWRRKRFG